MFRHYITMTPQMLYTTLCLAPMDKLPWDLERLFWHLVTRFGRDRSIPTLLGSMQTLKVNI